MEYYTTSQLIDLIGDSRPVLLSELSKLERELYMLPDIQANYPRPNDVHEYGSQSFICNDVILEFLCKWSKNRRVSAIGAMGNTSTEIELFISNHNLVKIIEDYSKCEFCASKFDFTVVQRTMSQVTEKYITDSCPMSLHCKNCDISIYHHYAISDCFSNFEKRNGYTCAVIYGYSAHSHLDTVKPKGSRLICPVAICEYCHVRFSVLEYSNFFYSDTANDDDLRTQFESWLKLDNRKYCPRCKYSSISLDLGITYFK
jgi:hypothetical protein